MLKIYDWGELFVGLLGHTAGGLLQSELAFELVEPVYKWYLTCCYVEELAHVCFCLILTQNKHKSK